MGIFFKSKCSKCCMCNCSCAAEEVITTTRKYTYDNLYAWENNYKHTDLLMMPTERIIVKKDEDTANLFYHQIDTEFYARNIHDSIPLVSYANGPFFKKLGDSSETSKFALPIISYVANPVYIKKSAKCKSGNNYNCHPCKCCCCCVTS